MRTRRLRRASRVETSHRLVLRVQRLQHYCDAVPGRFEGLDRLAGVAP
jgi:hypothetical protein